MNKDMENTFNQMAELGGSDERLGTNSAPIINAPLLPKNTRPTPVAPVSPTHRHKKRGSEYVLIGIGKMQAENWWERNPNRDQATFNEFDQMVDMREVALYRSVDDGSLWVRPREEFEDGRFEALSVVSPDATGKCGELVTVGYGYVNSLGELEYAHATSSEMRTEALCIRSQAVELLAAERAEKEKERLRFEGDLDKWMKIIGAGITGYQPEAYALMDLACEELVKLRADNAALTARVKVAEAGRDRTRKIFKRNTRLRFEAEKRAEALEAKISAAEKALTEIASFTQTTDLLWWQERARAALGGKPS